MEVVSSFNESVQHILCILMQNMKEVVFSGLSELELSQAANVPEYRTFSADFKFNRLTFKKEFN